MAAELKRDNTEATPNFKIKDLQFITHLSLFKLIAVVKSKGLDKIKSERPMPLATLRLIVSTRRLALEEVPSIQTK